MTEGDLVVVPHGGQFHVAEVVGPVRYLPDKVDEHSAFRRPVRWLKDGNPIPGAQARAALQSRMKVYQTCADASDLIPGDPRRAHRDRRQESNAHLPLRPPYAPHPRGQGGDHLRADGLLRLRAVVATVLRSLGASEVRIVPRSLDKGADIVATFSLADTFHIRLAVQAKHFRPDPPVGAHIIDQLVAGMEAEQTSLGWGRYIGVVRP